MNELTREATLNFVRGVIGTKIELGHGSQTMIQVEIKGQSGQAYCEVIFSKDNSIPAGVGITHWQLLSPISFTRKNSVHHTLWLSLRGACHEVLDNLELAAA